MSKQIQRRYLPRAVRKIELHERADGALPLISGYASVFYREGDAGTEYELWPGAVERIYPGAFDAALRDDDVVALFNHRSDYVLGRSSVGTVRLSVDAVGLRYEIDPPDTQKARDLIQSLRRGDVSGSSFSFLPRGADGYQRRVDGDRLILEGRNLRLFDVGPVTFPAYVGTSASARAADVESLRVEVEGERETQRDADLIAVESLLMEMEEA